ncbi:Ras-related protein Rab [Acrasis kona]|uniref:Ras-related protein Rab n=1 Tax=Acrasis kona TaxID=1008807 RepID=A0AAW2Z5B6_9EUKA
MKKFFTSTGVSDTTDAIMNDDVDYDEEQETEVINSHNREENLHWDYVESNANREKPTITDGVHILVIGDGGVGKSSLVEAYVGAPYPSAAGDEVQTNVNSRQGGRQKRVSIDRKETVVYVEDRITLDEKSNSMAQGVLVVFDVTSLQSFSTLPKWLKSIKQFCNRSVAVVLVGNKTDEANRVVNSKTAEEFAMKAGIRYFETSAKNETNVQETFNAMIHGVQERFTLQ